MKLPKMRRLMGLLARDMREKQVRELLAVLPTSYISQAEREDCTTAIRFFVLLKKRVGTDQAFLEKLERLLQECNREDFLSTIQKFKKDNPDLLASDSTSTLNLPNGTKAGFRPKPGQSDRFRSILLRISRTCPRKHLEIMVALPPIPEAEKQSIIEGHDLFHQMERHGCISENDTEMLEEILELFSLTDAIKHLTEYQSEFPPIIHEPKPTAPIYASPSVNMQAQYGSYGSLPPFSVSPHPGQHQSSHPSPQSLPPSTNAVGYSQHTVPPAACVSHQQPSPPVSNYSRQPSSASYPPSAEPGHSLLPRRREVAYFSSYSSHQSLPLSYVQKHVAGSSYAVPPPQMSGASPVSHSSHEHVGPSVPFISSHEQPSPPASKYSGNTSSASYPLSAEQAHSLSSSQMGRGSQVSPPSHSSHEFLSAPPIINAPYKESGEENPNKPITRQFVPSESPTRSRRPIGEATVQPFPSGGSASSPPDHTPSATGINNSYPRPLMNKHPRQLEGNVSTPSGMYQRPSQEGGNNYHFPSSNVLPFQGQNHRPQNLPRLESGDTSELMPPPYKIHRPLDHHTGDGCFLSKPAGPRAVHQESESSSSAQAETMSVSTVSSYTGDSDKFDTAISTGRPVNHSAEGSHLSLNTLESYSAGHSFASAHQPGDMQHAPTPAQHTPAAHSLPSYEAGTLNVPEGQQCEPSLPSLPGASGSIPSSAGSLRTFSSESNFSTPSQALQQPENGASVSLGSGHGSGAQFRNVPSSPGAPQPAHHPDDLVFQPQGGTRHQPFYQQASYSAAVMPPSSASSAPEGVSLSQNEPVTTGAAIAKNITPFGCESQPPGSGQKHRQRSSRAYSKLVAPSRSRSVLSKNEAQNVHKAAEFESLNQTAGGTAKLTQYQQQSHNFRQRYAAGVPSHAQLSEQGLPVAQASSLSNVSIQEETLKEDEKQQFPPAAENVSYGGSLYPTLPSLDTSTGTTGATQTGTKRGREQNQLPEGLEHKDEEVKVEEEPSCAKRKKTDKRVTRSEAKKKGGLISRFVGYVGSAIFGSSEASVDTGGSSSSDEQLQQEKSENTESETEFHDAEEY